MATAKSTSRGAVKSPAARKTPSTRPIAAKKARRAPAPPTPASGVPADVPPVAASDAPAAADASRPKNKLVRDSFTIPKKEYALLQQLKDRAAGLMKPVKKSEVLRAGIAALSAMPDAAFLAALESVPSLKTGRPKKQGANRRNES